MLTLSQQPGASPDRELSYLAVNEMVAAARLFASSASLAGRAAAPHSTSYDPRIVVPRLLIRMYRFPLESVFSLPWQSNLQAVLEGTMPASERRSSSISLRSAKLVEIDPASAQLIHQQRHYLGTFREGLHLGLAADDDAMPPLSLATLSRVDTPGMKALMRVGASGTALVLSRLYSCPSAPRNTLSTTLARIVTYIRTSLPHVRTLLTYCDPNLGFSGAAYRAANWFKLGHDIKLPYIYVDGEYITYRTLYQRFGTMEWNELSSTLRGRVERSHPQPLPLEVYAYNIAGWEQPS